VLIENLEGDAVPHRLRGDSHTVRDLVATAALVSNSPNDATYTMLESKIAGWVVRRDEIATSIRTLLDGATFKDQHFDDHQARQLITQARSLLTEVSRCAADTVRCIQ